MNPLWFVVPPVLGFLVAFVVIPATMNADKGERAKRGAIVGLVVGGVILLGILIWAVSNDTGVDNPFAGPTPTPTATLVPALQEAITLQTRVAEEAAQRAAEATLVAVQATATAMAAPAPTATPDPSPVTAPTP